MSTHSMPDANTTDIKLKSAYCFENSPDLQPDDAIVYIEKTEEEKRLVRKIDLFLLPCIWIVYLLSYML